MLCLEILGSQVPPCRAVCQITIELQRAASPGGFVYPIRGGDKVTFLPRVRPWLHAWALLCM